MSAAEADFGSLTASDARRFFNPPSSPPASPWRPVYEAPEDQEEQALQNLLDRLYGDDLGPE